MPSIESAKQEIITKFDFFYDWTERYQLLISLGKKLNFPKEKQIDKYLIKGCQSQVWIDSEFIDGNLHFTGVSDSSLVSGLMAVLFSVYNNQSPKDILTTKADFLEQIGFDNHLSPTRRNGLYEMLKKIKQQAQKYNR